VSQDSSVGIAVGPPGLDSRKGQLFLFSTASKPAPEPTQLPIKRVQGVQRPGREADNSPTSSVEVKMMELYFNSPIYLHGILLK
jgi:hypothetical protein